MKTAQDIKDHLQKGFTLIELLVVIGILGVLAVVLIGTIDPLDKINSASDSGVISSIAQLGKANDTFAATNNNTYPIATTFAGVVTALNNAGEIKYSTLTAPANYTFNYLAPSGCTVAAGCTSYAFYVNLRSKKYTSTPYYIYSNGKGCTKSAAPSDSTTGTC